jgi:hypothetical protein
MTTIIVVENLHYNDLDFNSFKESKWKKIGIKVDSNVLIDNTIMVDSTIKIIGMSIVPFFKPF